jgi:hypothetical protein
MKPNEITAQIVDAACRIHTQIGPGLLETETTSSVWAKNLAQSRGERRLAKEACAVWEPVDMAIPPKTARNRKPFHHSKFTIQNSPFGIKTALPAKLFSLL